MAEVDDPPELKSRLRPGTFVEVSVPFEARVDALVIPLTSVRPSDRGFLAYVLQGDQVDERVLELGLRTANGLVEVSAGLSAGETLVIRGGEALADSAPINVVKQTTLADLLAKGAPGGEVTPNSPQPGASAQPGGSAQPGAPK